MGYLLGDEKGLLGGEDARVGEAESRGGELRARRYSCSLRAARVPDGGGGAGRRVLVGLALREKAMMGFCMIIRQINREK